MLYLRYLFIVGLLLISGQVHASKVNDFSFTDIDGVEKTLSDYRGKWVVANYWAIFCPPCRVEIPDLIKFVEDHPDEIVVLGMDAGMDDDETLREFAEEQGINYPIIPTQDSTMYGFGEVRGIPTSFVISPEGELVDTHIGILTYDDLTKYVTASKEKSFWERIFNW